MFATFGADLLTAATREVPTPKFRISIGLLIALTATLWAAVARAQGLFGVPSAAPAGPTISEIKIVGNKRVEDDAIRIHISSKPGEPLNLGVVDQDVKAIYRMGFFSNVHAERAPGPAGKVNVIFRVVEQPMIEDVRLEGMKKIRSTDDKIQQAIRLHPHSIYDPARATETIRGIETAYRDKGYLDAKVTYRSIPQPNNTAVAVFDVSEGPKVDITQINFIGNHAFKAKELRNVMETSTHSPISFFTGSGTLDNRRLQDDSDRLTAFYYDHGYLNVHVGQPSIARHGNSLTVTVVIDEGEPYTVGNIALQGNLLVPDQELRERLTLKRGEVFRGSTLQHDVLTLSDFYSNRGYAFVNVDPRTALNPPAHTIDVVFNVTPGQEVLVDRIKISGNTKTSDKVIRREMRIHEQEPYSAEEIRESKTRIERLGIFDDTRITTEQGRSPDRINLNVGVREGNTGSFSLAGGFSTASSVFGNFRLAQNNLFGEGQQLAFDASVGFLFQNYTISYTEPYFLDMPLSAGVDLFDTRFSYRNFSRASLGFAVRTQYPLEELGLKQIGPLSLKNVSAGAEYLFENVGVTNISEFTTFDIRNEHGYKKTSEIIPNIRRFTVDNPVDPRKGSIQTLTVQIAGLGGDNEFIKGVVHGRWFVPFIESPNWGQWVYSIGGDFGIGTNLKSGTGGELPLFERFFPGGINSVRGYEAFRLGPRVTLFNQFGQPFSFEDIGGSKELLLTNEITFPLVEGLGIRGVIFLDAGNSFRLHDNISLNGLQAAWGMGIRWKSPFGPLRIEFGFPINPRPDDVRTDFIFGAGGNL